MPFTQNYDPLGNELLSALVAALPVVVLLGLLASGKASAPAAALGGLLTALALAVLVFTPAEVRSGDATTPEWARTVLNSTLMGAAFGLFPIGWIVVAAIFLYNLTVETGRFEVVKRSVLTLSDDRRIQALLIAFCFGAFVEGAAGFGTPVAISSALLIGAGFKPLHAAGLALLANTSPVAFGALGTPTTTLAEVTKLDLHKLSAMAGRQLPFFSLLVPAWLVWVMAGWRGVVGVWPALAVTGGSFALVQFLVANYHGPWLVDVAGGLISLGCLALFLRVWQPKQKWQFDHESGDPAGGGQKSPVRVADHPTGDFRPPPANGTRAVLSAWVPWLLLSVIVFCWGLAPVKNALDAVSLRLVPWPGLHEEIQKTPPVVKQAEPEKAVYRFNPLSAAGTGISLAALLSAAWLRVPPKQVLGCLGRTVYRLRWPLVTIALMLAIAYTTRYGGLDSTLGIAFTRTGWIYPLFAALLGWLGVALTGSDTSSNALFGNLQVVTATRLSDAGVLPLGTEQASILMATANSTGGVMGKMIDAQSIVVASAATNQPGQEGAILRFVFWHSLVLALLIGVLVMVQAYWWTASIP